MINVSFSSYAVDLNGDQVLFDENSDKQLETASIGKLFLLIDVARRLDTGEFSPDQTVQIPEAHRVEESGILYRMRDQELQLHDLALLVGAFSDNLATNALLSLCGLDRVRRVATELGYTDSALLDYIRDEARTDDVPWTPSYGTSRELCDLMVRLERREIISATVSDQVLTWLAADADTSMLADAFLLDPLAHVTPDYQNMTLRHKTGSTEVVRADVGIVTGTRATVAYAVIANWRQADVDLRAPVISRMREYGELIRAHVTGSGRDEPTHMNGETS
jgi:beta-lactamase class A